MATSLRWQTDIMALPLNITTRDLIIEPLDIGFCHAMSLEASPRSGLDVDLVWTQLPHSLDTQSTPHPQTLALHADWTSTSTVTGCSAKEGPEGQGVFVYMVSAQKPSKWISEFLVTRTIFRKSQNSFTEYLRYGLQKCAILGPLSP